MGMMGTIRLSRCLIFQWPSLQLSSSFIWRWDVTFLQLTMIEVVSPSDTVIPWYPITRHFLARPMALRGSMISSVSFLGPVQSTSASMMSIKALGWSFMAWWFTTLTFYPLLAKWIPVTIIRIHHFKRGPHATKSQVFQIGEIFWVRMGNYNLPQETIHKPCLGQNVGVGFAPRFLEPKKTLIISLAEKKNRRWSGAYPDYTTCQTCTCIGQPKKYRLSVCKTRRKIAYMFKGSFVEKLRVTDGFIFISMCLKRSRSHILTRPRIIVSSWHVP